MIQSTAWPKRRPELTCRQKEILEDWYGYWLTLMPNRYSGIVRFNHSYAIRTATPRGRTLEIGAGEGEHMRYETLETQEYYALELREALANRLHARFPQVKVIVGDCEDRIDVPDQFFDRIVAIHVLEHAQHAAHEAGSVQAEAKAFVDTVIPAQNALREVADELETLVSDELWPLPKYRELLFQY